LPRIALPFELIYTRTTVFATKELWMAASNAGKRHNLLSRVLVFVILLAFWVVFSGLFDAFHLTLGVISCLIVTLMSHDLLITKIRREQRFGKAMRFIVYFPWLMWQIVLANFHVVRMVLQPSKIKPHIIKFDAKLKDDLARVLLGNSITLTPGTITMAIDDDEFVVHALDQQVADDLLTGEMEKRVARVFYED
jgi:multicomponent Na+:H+ antiporter subunit E